MMKLFQALPYDLSSAGVRAYQVGQWLTLTTKLGMRVTWDGATRVQVSLVVARRIETVRNDDTVDHSPTQPQASVERSVR